MAADTPQPNDARAPRRGQSVQSLTKAEWIAEVTSALREGSIHLQVFAAVVEVTSPMCYAELIDGKSTRRISLARDRYPTPAARRTEILRQLHSPPAR
jgi:hypothetical protein